MSVLVRLISLSFRRFVSIRRDVVSLLLKGFYRISFYPNVSFSKSARFESSVRVAVTDGGKLDIEDGVFISRGTSIVVKGGVLQIKAGSFLGPYCTVVCSDRITIGENNLIAERVSVRDQNHGMSLARVPFNAQATQSMPIFIGPNVWLGAGVFVGAGVSLGENVVVGANAAVVQDLEPGCLYGGVPARKIDTIK